MASGSAAFASAEAFGDAVSVSVAASGPSSVMASTGSGMFALCPTQPQDAFRQRDTHGDARPPPGEARHRSSSSSHCAARPVGKEPSVTKSCPSPMAPADAKEVEDPAAGCWQPLTRPMRPTTRRPRDGGLLRQSSTWPHRRRWLGPARRDLVPFPSFCGYHTMDGDEVPVRFAAGDDRSPMALVGIRSEAPKATGAAAG